jgi:hypothetical protein
MKVKGHVTGVHRESRLAYEVLQKEKGPGRSIVGLSGWLVWAFEGLPLALLAGGPLDAPDRVAAGSMLGVSRYQSGWPDGPRQRDCLREPGAPHPLFDIEEAA